MLNMRSKFSGIRGAEPDSAVTAGLDPSLVDSVLGAVSLASPVAPLLLGAVSAVAPSDIEAIHSFKSMLLLLITNWPFSVSAFK